MKNGSIFINEKITRTEKFSPYPPKFGNKFYMSGLKCFAKRCESFQVGLLIGLQPIWILSTNMFAFIPLNCHNLPDIFFLICLSLSFAVHKIPAFHLYYTFNLSHCWHTSKNFNYKFKIYNVNNYTNREKSQSIRWLFFLT